MQNHSQFYCSESQTVSEKQSSHSEGSVSFLLVKSESQCDSKEFSHLTLILPLYFKIGIVF